MRKISFIALVMVLVLMCVGSPSFAAFGEDPTIIRSSEVFTTVTNNGDGTYTYNYTVKNTSPGPQWVNDGEVWPVIVDFEVPLDSPDVVWNIQSPETWSFEFLSAQQFIDRYNQPNPFNSAYVIHWYDVIPMVAKGIVPTGYNDRFESDWYEPQTDGFIFTSNLGPVDGPYTSSWWDQYRWIGDPPLPGGSVGGGGTPTYRTVPEPSCLLLLLAGIGLVGSARLRRK